MNQDHPLSLENTISGCLGCSSNSLLTEMDKGRPAVPDAHHQCKEDGEGMSEWSGLPYNQSSMLSLNHEVPTRQRFNTAETEQIRNYMPSKHIPLATENTCQIKPTSQGEDDTLRDDLSSIVSSLSKDDSLLASESWALNEASAVVHEDLAQSPPMEVSIPFSQTGPRSHPQVNGLLPNWFEQETGSKSVKPLRPRLFRDHSLPANSSDYVPRPQFRRDVSAPTVIQTITPVVAVPSIRTAFFDPCTDMPCPTLGRNQSSPAMDFHSVASSSIQTLNSSSIEGSTSCDHGSFCPYSSKSLNGHHYSKPTRRRDCSNPASDGQTSLTTSTTTSSSYMYTGSMGSSVRKSKSAATASRKLCSYVGADDGAGCCSINAEDKYRKKNFIKQEFKYIVGTVLTPIRKLSRKGDVKLQRSGGRLT